MQFTMLDEEDEPTPTQRKVVRKPTRTIAEAVQSVTIPAPKKPESLPAPAQASAQAPAQAIPEESDDEDETKPLSAA